MNWYLRRWSLIIQLSSRRLHWFVSNCVRHCFVSLYKCCVVSTLLLWLLNYVFIKLVVLRFRRTLVLKMLPNFNILLFSLVFVDHLRRFIPRHLIFWSGFLSWRGHFVAWNNTLSMQISHKITLLLIHQIIEFVLININIYSLLWLLF